MKTLEAIFASGGISLVTSVFHNTFFLHPSVVRRRTPYFPAFARYSREHCGAGTKGATALWRGSPCASMTTAARRWPGRKKYSGRALSRGVGFAIRHISG
ncbi:MAG: hypothetical protein ACLP8S_25270 [Solirubrobacteraceae bacterium]